MDYTKELSDKISIVNNWIDELAPRGAGYHKVIYDSMNYSLRSGGKRLRPVIALSVCEMLGGNTSDLKHFACAIEFIHTYSLIHDDLPCMDNDELRRGVPTNHIKYGEALALLAGDALLNYAFEAVAKSDAKPDLIAGALAIISTASGTEGMIGGQVVDIAGAKNEAELLKMHEMKTGAMILSAAKIGALVASADEESTRHIEEFAKALGMAFQIRDDILDVLGNEKVFGKPIGSDEKCSKFTFVDLFGIEGAKCELENYTNVAKQALSFFEEKADFLMWLCDYLIRRDK